MNYPISRSNKRMLYLILFLHCLAIFVPSVHAGDIKAKKKYDYNWASLKSHPIPQWFDDAKFGIFIHWGAYSVMGYRRNGRGYAEHTPKELYRNPDHYYEYLKETFGAHPPEFGYKDIIPMFKAENWNPNRWAELFQKAGARYVVLTAEHHDGYAMWDSDLTQWCATKIGPKRDLVGELGKAVRKRGMKYAPSYHRERHTGFFALEKYAIKSPPHPDIIEEIARMSEAAELYGPFEYSDAFIKDYVARWKEIEKKYRPDFMWIDDIPIFYKIPPHPQTKKFRNAFVYMIADYFNAAEGWGKEVYLNNKGANLNWPEGPGCREKDNLKMETIGPKWENPATLGTSYGYMKAEEERDAYKHPTELIHLLCDIVSKNGNLLLNIGPRGDGTIPEGMQQRLLSMGKWLKVNGEAIYGTRPWVTFKQDKPDLRFTTKRNALYAIALAKPTKSFIIQSTKEWRAGSVRKVILLGSDKTIEWEETQSGIRITPPRVMPGKYAWVFKIIYKK
ncbi:MAG: alpha-L-fucosidase [Planctomycetes bacterium]|nr:alpha-L-fucosidase [Planctomycetota bacterium]